MSVVTQDMLMAYADGQLNPSDRAAVEAHLAANPEAAMNVALWQRQSGALRALFAPAGLEPVPARLRPHRIAASFGSRRARSWRRAGAAIVLVALGLGAGWFARPWLAGAPQASDILIADAVNAHTVFVAENRHAVEVAASEEGHLVTWLSNRLATPLGTPDLSAEGFTLVGGRLLPGAPDAGGRAAQLMYENAAHDRVTVYVTAALTDRATGYQFATYDGAEAFYWANARITCTVVGTLPEAEMKTVSQAVYRQMSDGDGTAGLP
ncbi:anti-sigma factor family protein [uncultured Devosia sp.]|uniref:anti-sigma factor family protein n=1 Tax=uncultured Devosia sp. TaxID=211434 RepID=UPI0035CBD2D6